MLSLLVGMRRVGNSPQRGPEWHGPCPVCGGRDRFHVWPEQGQGGSFWCRGCDKAGDLVEFYRWRDGLGYRDACARAGVDAQRYNHLSAPSVPKAWSEQRSFTPVDPGDVSPGWAEHAAKFASWCHGQLLANDAQLAWLAERGIDAGQVAKFGLGWNPQDTFRPRASWGLPMQYKDNGSPRKLWLPMGLVIPQWLDGRLARLRIRRPEGDPKYYVIPGSGREPLITQTGASAYVVVESELDALLLDGLVGNTVGVVAMGNASAKPTADCHAHLARALHLSISLDSDTPRVNQATGKTESAGAQGSLWWTATYPQAERVPVIGGKDPGDAYKAGVDLSSWVLAGLPPRFHLRQTPAAPMAIPQETISPPSASQAAHSEEHSTPVIKHYQITVAGFDVHITDNQDLWQQLVDEGAVVFSENELLRLQTACTGMDNADRQDAVTRVIEAKQVFPGAYVRRGDVCA